MPEQLTAADLSDVEKLILILAHEENERKPKLLDYVIKHYSISEFNRGFDRLKLYNIITGESEAGNVDNQLGLVVKGINLTDEIGRSLYREYIGFSHENA